MVLDLVEREGAKNIMKKYDIVLILDFFRTLTYYLSIIKYLSRDYTIGLFPVDIGYGQLEKNGKVQEMFVQTCVDFGAELVKKNKPVQAKVLLIPQRPYLKSAMDDIRKNIHATRTVGVLAFSWAEIPKYDAFIDEFAISKLFVIDRHFIDFQLENRVDNPEARSTYDGCEMVEIGLPYNKYPIFPSIEADYLFAMPTPFSFAHEKDKWDFLGTVAALFTKMENGDRVIHKPHNAMERDQFSNSAYRSLIWILNCIPGIFSVIRGFASISPKKLKIHFERLYTAYLYEKVIKRTIPLEKLTHYHSFAMEAFLPGVKKGVIGGLSNTIWGTLFSKIPFYNCVDIHLQDRGAEDRLYGKKKVEQVLELNLKYFFVPYCEGNLAFDKKYFEIVNEKTRQSDLIAELKKEIKHDN